MDAGLKLSGIMTASALVLGNNVPTLVKVAARLAKLVFGDRIQICSGAADNVQIIDAIDSLTAGRTHKETVKLIGRFSTSGLIDGASLMILDSTQAMFSAAGDNIVLQFSFKSDSEVWGGIFDGTNQTDDLNTMRLISLSSCTNITVRGPEVNDGGYYGLNMFDCNDCRIRHLRADGNFIHGVHNGSNTVGRGRRNSFDDLDVTNSGSDGINDYGTNKATEEVLSIYSNSRSYSNGGNGMVLTSLVATATPVVSYQVTNCQTDDNVDGLSLQWCQAYVVNHRSRHNSDAGYQLNGCDHVYLDNSDGSYNGQLASAGGIKVVDAGGIGNTNITVRGGRYTNNWRNFYITTTVGCDEITVEDADLRNGVDSNLYQTGTVTHLRTRNNQGYIGSGEIVTIQKLIDHSILVDDGGASGHIDFDDQIEGISNMLVVYYYMYEKWVSTNTTTLTMMVGIPADLDAFTNAVDPGVNVHNIWDGGLWDGADCQDRLVGAAVTPRVTFTEDNDITDIISGPGAAGGLIMRLNYLKA